MRYTVRVARDNEAMAALDRIWTVSQDADDRGFLPRGGWWSLRDWAARAALLYAGEIPIGATAVKVAPDGALETRLALLPDRRTPEAARRLVQQAIDEAHSAGLAVLRLTLPAAAAWASNAANRSGFAVVRSTLVLLRPAALGPLPAPVVPGVHLRPLADGEEGKLLRTLNHAWSGTWNFRPLTRRALERDLAGQRSGFLVAVDDGGRIVGTVHAQFDPAGRNPDGGAFAWLSNLTTAPIWRGRGLGRSLLSAGITQLHQQGARSVTLGVDSGALAPVTLYRSAGFTEIDRLELWETQLDGVVDGPTMASAELVRPALAVAGRAYEAGVNQGRSIRSGR